MRTRQPSVLVVDTWQPHGSSKFYATHDPKQCFPNPCCVHRPSEHHMKDWPQNYRDDTGVTERVCGHGVGHPDPDQPWPTDDVRWMHGCCGCCAVPSKEPEQPIDNSIALIAAIVGGAAAV